MRANREEARRAYQLVSLQLARILLHKTSYSCQLSDRLRGEINGPVMILRSGDASNLKTVLKKVIRDAANQRSADDDEGTTFEHDVRSLKKYSPI